MVRLLIALAIAGKLAHAGPLAVGDPVTEFDVAIDAARKPVKLASYRGRWVVIASGASWCKPCAKELPLIDAIAPKFRATFIALDLDDDVADAIVFHTKLKLAHLTRVYLPDSSSKVGDRFGNDRMPFTVVIDPKAIVRAVVVGYDSAGIGRLEAELARLVPATPPPTPPTPPKPPVAPKPVVATVPRLVLLAPHPTWQVTGLAIRL